MKILLLLKKEIKFNIGTPVLNKPSGDYKGFSVAYEINPKSLKRAIKILLDGEEAHIADKGEIKEIITLDCCNTERKFRNVYADTIDYLEKRKNRDKEGLPQRKKPETKSFDISEKDKELLKRADVSKLEIAFAKMKPKCKSLAFKAKAYWKHLKGKTYHRKKIPVFISQYGFSFSTEGVKFLALSQVDKETVKEAESFLDKSLRENEEYIIKEYDSRCKKLITSYVPLLTDNRKEVIRKSIQNIAVIAFVIAGVYLLYNSVYKSVENTAIQSEIQSIYYDGEVSEKVKSQDHAKNFKKLKSINKEIVAWISIPHTKVDYPVLYHKDDTLNTQYYLYNNYQGDYSEYGSIFVDFRSQQGEKSKNVILHGHHMMDGSMFSNLLKYGKTSIDMDFYKKSPTVTFSTEEGTSIYKIISVFKTTGYVGDSDFFNYLQGDFLNDAEFMNYVYNVRARSMVNCPVDVNEKDRLLTLSTCSYEVHSNYRTVVVARKIRKGESKSVAVSKATKNYKAYFPSDFYYRFGGTQPKLTSFKTELKKGNINWYDGNGKLKGKEELTGGKFVRDLTSTTKETSTTTKPTSKTTTSTTKPREKTYTVKFLDSKGKVIKTQRVKENGSAKAPKAPKKASVKGYKYTFLKWDKSFSKVKGNLTVKPVYKISKISKPKPTKPKPTKPKPTKPKETKPKATKPKTTVKPTKPTKATNPTTKPIATVTTTTVPETEPQLQGEIE